MYQQNRINMQSWNKNSVVPNRNAQSVSAALSSNENQQANMQYQNSTFASRDFQNNRAGDFRNVTPHQVQQNHPYVPTYSKVVPLETNIFYNNGHMLNQGALNKIQTATTSLRPTESVPSSHGNNTSYSLNMYNQQSNLGSKNAQTFQENVQPRVFMQCSLPAALTSQNKSFNVQYGGERSTGENRMMIGRNDDDKSDTKSVTSNSGSVKSAAWRAARGNENEKIRIFTGTAEKIIKWHKVYKDHFCFYELIASVIAIQEGTVRLQKIMLLRDKNGPIIQVIHYVNDHINIENFLVGQMLRCVGRMVGPNVLHGLSIREARPDEITTLRRMCYIGDHAISKALKKASLRL